MQHVGVDEAGSSWIHGTGEEHPLVEHQRAHSFNTLQGGQRRELGRGGLAHDLLAEFSYTIVVARAKHALQVRRTRTTIEGRLWAPLGLAVPLLRMKHPRGAAPVPSYRRKASVAPLPPDRRRDRLAQKSKKRHSSN